MHKPKKRNLDSTQKHVDWLKYLDDCQPPLVIPVGRRFQAAIPEWTGPSNDLYQEDDSDASKWFGTKIWPPEDDTKTREEGKIGKGRPDSCSCSSPKSPQCVKRHISEEQVRLQSELGPVYKSWKFNEMGEDVAKSWSSRQRQKFDYLVRTNPLSEGKSFLMPAESSFPSKSRENIVSYYLNVYIPKRIGMLTRSGCKVVDSDDDVVEETPNAKKSSKRSRSQTVDLVKSHYLTGRR